MGEAETEIVGEQKQSHYKRKRKKTFLRNAKKYAKKGCYGRGSHLEADIYEYLVRIMEVYNAGFPSEEEKLMFVNNVFDQIDDQEIKCACNQVGCRIIEILLPFASNNVLEKFITSFSSELRPLCSDRFASHVLEALVRIFCKKALDESTDEEFRIKSKEYALKISKFLLNNLEDYVWDMYGNHIIRSVLEALAQIPKQDPNSKKDYNKPEEVAVKIEIPEDFQEVINEYAQRLSVWPQFTQLPFEELPSGLLQVLVKVLARTNKKLLTTYVKKLLNESFIIDTEETVEKDATVNILPKVFMSKAALMLLETMIEVVKRKNFTQIYAKLFVNNLTQLALMKSTNFAVQKLLIHSKEKTEFEAMFDELHDSFKEIIENGYTGVILALVQSCKRLATKQGSFVQDLTKSLNCDGKSEAQNDFVIAALKMSPRDKIDVTNADKMTLHGTLVVQTMLQFNKPIKIVNGLLSLDANLLKVIFCDRMGSHVVDAYMSSAYVGEKSREKLVRQMQGTYQQLAASKCGSRSFEAIWGAANLKHREAIMGELSHKNEVWSNTDAGKIIAGKLNLQLYKKNKEEWKTSLNKSGKIKAMFADILSA